MGWIGSSADMRRGLAIVLAAGLVTACGSREQGAPEHVEQGAQENVADGAAASHENPLERAAIAAGLVTDIRGASVVGLYRQRHESGRDSLCILPSAQEEKGKAAGDGDSPLRFGLEASFGENVECHGEGTVRPSGDKLVLSFARSRCIVVAHYDGDRIDLPGALDTECRKFCSERGSLEGVSFPRVSRDASVAAAAEAKAGGRLCPSA